MLSRISRMLPKAVFGLVPVKYGKTQFRPANGPSTILILPVPVGGLRLVSTKVVKWLPKLKRYEAESIVLRPISRSTTMSP